MPKKRLVDGRVLDKILGLYPELSPDRKGKFLASIRDKDPNLARAFDKWEGSFIDLLQSVKKIKQKYGKDTSDIDTLISRVKGK